MWETSVSALKLPCMKLTNLGVVLGSELYIYNISCRESSAIRGTGRNLCANVCNPAVVKCLGAEEV